MTNDNQIVIRAREFKMGPDVEHYLQKLKKDGTLKKLSEEGNLTVDSIKNTSLGNMCDIFEESFGMKMEPGDILIFGDSANFELMTGGGFPQGQSP